MLSRYTERRFYAYSIPVMLIGRRLTKDKRVVTDFRHLNMCIVKNNLAYLLLKDTFALLGTSPCEGNVSSHENRCHIYFAFIFYIIFDF